MDKICFTCKKVLSIDLFPLDKANKDGHKGRCGKCIIKYTSEYNKEHPKPAGYWYARLVKRRKRIKDQYGIGGGFLFRYPLPILIEIFSKYNRRCDMCRSSENLTIHHIDGRGRHHKERGGKMNNDPSNLQLLCRRCHGSIDGRKGRGVKQKRVIN